MKEGKYPEVLINGIWSPICGLHFGKNNISAAIYCRKLDLEVNNGIMVGHRDLPLETNTIRIGQCLNSDHWLNCSEECNDLGNNKCATKCGTTKSTTIKIQCNQGIYMLNIYLSNYLITN